MNVSLLYYGETNSDSSISEARLDDSRKRKNERTNKQILKTLRKRRIFFRFPKREREREKNAGGIASPMSASDSCPSFQLEFCARDLHRFFCRFFNYECCH